MTGDSVESRFAARMGRLLGPEFPTDIALAVSGGGDSMSMLALAHGWARVMGVRLWVVTVDHGLRQGSADEAALVARECAALGHPHATLRWHWDGQGNLMQEARRARLALIDRWRMGVEHVLMAHTRDDVAETFLMRLKRGSGVEGLSAMAAKHWVEPRHPGGKRDLPPGEVTQTETPPIPKRRVAGVPAYSPGFHLIRPLLDTSRAELRHYADTLQVPYVDDPANEDARYDRARMRRLIGLLAEEGIDAETLSDTAHRMARAAEALKARADDLARVIRRDGSSNHTPTGDVFLNRERLARVERDSQMRLLSDALCRISSNPLRPRARTLEDALDRALAGGGSTLHGCEIQVGRTEIHLFREYDAVRNMLGVPDGVWDTRWRVYGSELRGCAIRALGEDGWAQVTNPPDGAPLFAAARSLPAAFDGDRLVACRALGVGPPHMVELITIPGAYRPFPESD